MPSKYWPCSLHHVCRFCYLIWSKTSSSPYVLLVKCLFKELRLRLRFLLLAPYWNWKWFPSATEMTWHSPRQDLNFSHKGKSWCESSKRSSHKFMENKKLTLEPIIRCLRGPGFREISSRENAPWNLDVCKYFIVCEGNILQWKLRTWAIQLYCILYIIHRYTR